MKIGDTVEYRVDLADWHEGVIVDVDHDSERVVVRDTDDGSTWSGSMDHVSADR